MPELDVSIIVPTYKDTFRLQECLRALSRQTYPSNHIEILVVNNCPESPLGDLGILSNVRVLGEPKAGSYAARNKGILAAKGSILGFTDSDCQPAVDWIEKAVEVLRSRPWISRVGGRVEIVARPQEFRSMAEYYDIFFAFPQDYYIRRENASVTANLFSWRTVFEDVGLFRQEMYSGADIEWGRRAERSGYKIAYVPEAVVFHAARESVRELVRKALRVGGGLHDRASYPFLDAHLSMLKASVPPVAMYKRALNIKGSGIAKVIAMLLHYYLKFVKSYAKLKVAYGGQKYRH